MLKHARRHWNETRGDQHDALGTSWWYSEVADDGRVIRQVEQYESGVLLHYGAEHLEDRYGGLAQMLLDLSESVYLYIPRQVSNKYGEMPSPWHANPARTEGQGTEDRLPTRTFKRRAERPTCPKSVRLFVIA